MSGFCSAHRGHDVGCPTCAKTPREILIDELHDAMGDCELCPVVQGEPGCDLKHQLGRAYGAGVHATRTDCAARGCMWCREKLKDKPGGMADPTLGDTTGPGGRR